MNVKRVYLNKYFKYWSLTIFERLRRLSQGHYILLSICCLML